VEQWRSSLGSGTWPCDST